MFMNPCGIRRDDEIDKSITVLMAQRLARGIHVADADPRCISCPRLAALSGRIRELSQRINELEIIPFDAVR